VLVVAGVMAAPMASAHHDMVQSPGGQIAPAESGLPAGLGGPVDEPEDVAAGGWAGHVPVRRTLGEPVTAADADGPVPEHVGKLDARPAVLTR
jgi:hypothetical protein